MKNFENKDVHLPSPEVVKAYGELKKLSVVRLTEKIKGNPSKAEIEAFFMIINERGGKNETEKNLLERNKDKMKDDSERKIQKIGGKVFKNINIAVGKSLGDKYKNRIGDEHHDKKNTDF